MSRILERLHDLVIVWLCVVLTIVLLVGLKAFSRFRACLSPDSKTLEVAWTAIPVGILLSIASPSIYLLCLQDSRAAPEATVKVTGNQWNWQRETLEAVDHLLDSDIVEVSSGYETPLILKSNRSARVATIRSDVLHSLGVPSLGVKLDAAPGRIRITLTEATPGVFLGSCYELCGRGHRAIPINVVSI